MKGKLTLAQIRVILLLAAVLLIVITYFLVFQTNMDSARDFDEKTKKEKKRIEYLTDLEVKANDLDIYTSLYTGDIDDFIKSFPVKLTQQRSLALIYRMMIDTGIDIESVTAGAEVPFYYKGKVLSSEGDQSAAQKESEAEGDGKQKLSEISVVDMEEMIGSTAKYTINMSGSTQQVYDALDWISKNKEKMSVGDVSLQFDSSTGKLQGSISANFYSMLGNGVPYKDPGIDSFSFGIDNVFGEFSK